MKMKKKLASMLTVIMLACSLPCQAQAAAPIVSNKPHKAPVATPPAVSEARPVKAVPEPAAVKADTAAKPAAEVKAPKQAKPEKKAKKTALFWALKKAMDIWPAAMCGIRMPLLLRC